MPKIKINIFGEGIEIRQLHLEPDIYQHWSAIAAKKNKILTDLLLDPFFYHGLKDKKIKEFNDITATHTKGMLDTTKSQIEIWFKRKKILKLQANDLFNQTVLFPLYKIEKAKLIDTQNLDPGIYVIQKTIGLLNSKYLEIPDKQLDIDDFLFSVSEFDAQKVLVDITFQNQNFIFRKNDTMITYQTAFEIHNNTYNQII